MARAHSHPFWQLEVFESGRTRMSAGGATREAVGGWMVLLPPFTEHVSEYLEDGTRTMSLKLEVEHPLRSQVLWRGPSSTSAHIVNALVDLLPPTMRQLAPNRHVVDALVSALVSYMVTPVDAPDGGARHLTTAERARQAVLACSRWPLTVPRVAAQAGLSPSRVSHLFLRAYGTSLKSFIDRTRAETAAEHLTYGNMTISEVAELMGFESLQSFSRFFARVKGTSPRSFRNAASSARDARLPATTVRRD